MKKESTSKKLLFAITLLFSLVIGFGMNKAQAAAPEQIPGDYTAHVTYLNADNPSEESMIETGGLWDKAIKYTVGQDGSADLTIQQQKMMGYMSSVNYIGQNAKGAKVPMQKTKIDDNNGSWKAHLTPALAAEIQANKTVTVQMTYTVPGLFSHDVNVLVKINSVDEPDRAAYEQNQKLMAQNKELQEQLAALKNEVTNNPKLSQLQNSVDSLQKQNTQLAADLAKVNEQNKGLSQQVASLQKQVEALNQKIAALSKELTPQPAGTKYTATVNYTKPGSTEPSALNEFFGKTITYVKDAKGQVTVQLKQAQMLDLMKSATFNGQKMTKTSDGWSLKYQGALADIDVHQKFTVGVSYNAMGRDFNHEADVEILSITPDGFGTEVTQPAPKPTPAPAPKPKDPAKKPTTPKKPAEGVEVASLTQTGQYTASVDYKNFENPKEDSMINGGIWSKNIKLVKHADGTVTVTIKQPKMLDYMSSLYFDGVQMKKVKQGNGAKDAPGYGYWIATLSAAKANDLKKGNTIVVSMAYTVPGVISHNVKANVVINKIVTGSVQDDQNGTNDKKDRGNNQIPATSFSNDPTDGQITSTSVPADGLPVPAPGDPAYLPQTGEQQAANNELTVGLILLVIAVSGIAGLSIYRGKQNA